MQTILQILFCCYKSAPYWITFKKNWSLGPLSKTLHLRFASCGWTVGRNSVFTLFSALNLPQYFSCCFTLSPIGLLNTHKHIVTHTDIVTHNPRGSEGRPEQWHPGSIHVLRQLYSCTNKRIKSGKRLLLYDRCQIVSLSNCRSLVPPFSLQDWMCCWMCL